VNFEQIVPLIKKFIDKVVNLDKTLSKPSAGFIINRMLTLPGASRLVRSSFNNKEIVQLAYAVYFMFKGNSLEAAIWKSKNDLSLLKLREVGDSYTLEIECEECYGDGYIDCDECEGSGNEECEECEGTGLVYDVDVSDEDMECQECEGTGQRPCWTCSESGGHVDCDNCVGSGTHDDDEDTVFYNDSVWVIGNPELSQKLDSLEQGTFIPNIEELLDEYKGDIVLLSWVEEADSEPIYDFESTYGNYSDLHKSESIEFLRDYKETSPSSFIEKPSNKNLIGYRI